MNDTTLQGTIHNIVDKYIRFEAMEQEFDAAIRLAKLLRRKIEAQRTIDAILENALNIKEERVSAFRVG